MRRFKLSAHLLVALRSLCDDFLELDDQMLALLELCLVLLFFGQEQALQLALLVPMLVYNQVVLGLELR